MARGAGGLRHVGAAARAPTAAGMLQPYSDGLARDRCATAAAEILLPVIALPAAYFAAARGAGWLRWMREGLFRGRQEVQVLFTGTKRESSLQKHASGENDFRGEESSAGPGTNWMQTQPRR